MNNIEELALNISRYQGTNIPELWRKTRILLGYGVNELAAALDTSGAQISRIESGERVPSAELIIKFAQLKERTMSKTTFINIEVGQLPKWYLDDEGNYDTFLEEAIERHWRKNPEFAKASIQVTYNYQTQDAVVKAYSDDGDLLWQRDDHDYGYALEHARNSGEV